jgi:hypothetical protein
MLVGDRNTLHQFDSDALVVPREVIVPQILRNGSPQMRLAQGQDPVEALSPDRQHESFREGVRVRAARRQPDDLHPTPFRALFKFTVTVWLAKGPRKLATVRGEIW